MNKMNCDKILQLNLLLDNELPEAESRKLLAHLETCEICAAEWRELQATRELWRDNQPLTMSPQALASLHRNVDSAMGRVVIERIAYRLTSLAALVVIAAGLWIIRPDSTTATTPVTAKTSITVPDTMETIALKFADDTAAASGDVAVATWVVADLSSMTSPRLR